MGRRAWPRLAVVVLLSGCGGSVYTLPYVDRVLTHQDAGTSDFLWKPFEVTPASARPTWIPVEAGLEGAAVEIFEDQLAGESLQRFMARTNTYSLLIIHDGRLVLERYAPGISPSSLQATFSVSKSLLSLYVGWTLDEGVLETLDVSITESLPELLDRDPRFSEITLADLIDMRSGIAYDGRLTFPFFTNDAPLVYHASDLRRVVLSKTRIADAPGGFHYNDYNPNLLGLALERIVGEKHLADIRKAFWNELGAEDAAIWSVDDRGFPHWESGLAATARDLAKVGMLLLEEGSHTLLSRRWLDRIVTYTPETPLPEYDGRQWSYRAGWWLILRPDGVHDVAAIGRFGQMIYVSPSSDIVIVRTGGDENAPGDVELVRLFYSIAPRLRGLSKGDLFQRSLESGLSHGSPLGEPREYSSDIVRGVCDGFAAGVCLPGRTGGCILGAASGGGGKQACGSP